LSPEASAEAGEWRTDRAPYQKALLDALTPNSPYERVVFMSSSQVGKTECLNSFVGYVIDQDPGPVLVVQPRVEDGESWSKDRLAPMLRDTPCLRGKVADVRSRDSNNRILHKRFQGGSITIAGANSPAGLAMRPIRYVLLDEVDRYPPSAGTEGDPPAPRARRWRFRRQPSGRDNRLLTGSTPPRAKNTGDGGRPAAAWKPHWPSVPASAGLAADSAYPSPGSRECGLRDGS
jgi:phage terminase large subunit GpA-like protein